MTEFLAETDEYLEKLEKRSIGERENIMKSFKCEVRKFETNCLPIYAKRSTIKQMVARSKVSVIVADTGSGKSTQIPQYLSDFFENQTVLCTQPRKVAAISLAQRVADEMSVAVGREVGYRTGLNSRFENSSKIIYVVDSVLLQECVKDPLLKRYACVIVDEAHERSLSTDIILGMLKTCLRTRPEFRIVITSATIDPRLFVDYFKEFGECPVLNVPGKTFPVDIKWSANLQLKDRKANYLQLTVEEVKNICRNHDDGDVLAFLTTPAETEQASAILTAELKIVYVLQLHGRLQPKDQELVFKPAPNKKRKVVFATNSAETSVTIPGIKFVVDCGFVKERKFDAVRGTSSLEVSFISKSSAKQRAGRSGRTGPGICYRLYSEEDYKSMAEMFVPEILRVNLGQTLLYLMSMKIEDPLIFDFIECPSPTILRKAYDLLINLGAIEESKLSETGLKMSKINLEPRLSKFVLTACKENLIDEAVVVAASVSVGNIFYRVGTDEQKEQADISKLEFTDDIGDILTYLNVFSKWNELHQNEKGCWCAEKFINGKCMNAIHETVKEIRYSLSHDLKIDINQKLTLDANKAAEILPKIYFLCFSENVAMYTGHPKIGYFSPVVNEYIFIHPGSSVNSCTSDRHWIVFEYILTTTKTYAINVLTIDEDWISESNIDPSWINLIQQKVVVPVELNNWGFSVKRSLWYQRNDLLKILSDKPCITEMNFQDPWLSLKVFCHNSFRIPIENAARKLAHDVLEPIRLDNLEYQLNRSSRTRICLGAGGEIKEILSNDEYRSVLVNDVPQSESSVDKVKAMLGVFGTITKAIKYSASEHVYKIEKWGLITFSFANEARLAYESMKEMPEYRLLPHAPAVSSSYCGESKEFLPIRISWCRRQSKRFGFISFNNCDELSTAMIFLSAHLNVKLAKKKAGSETTDILVQNLSPSMTSEELEALVKSILSQYEITFQKAFIVLEKSFETTDQQLELFERLLRNHLIFGPYPMFEDEFALTVDKPRSNADVIYRGRCHIKNENKAVQASKAFSQFPFEINLRPVKFEADIHMEITIAAKIYEVMGPVLREFANEISKRYSKNVVQLEIVNLKSGRTVGRINGSDYECALQVRALLQEQMRGDEIDCNQGALKILLTPAGDKFLHQLEKESQIFVSCNKVRREIRLFGTPAELTKAKIEINKFLDLKIGNSMNNYQLDLKSNEWPRSIIKLLMKTYKNSVDHIVAEIDECTGIQINCSKRQITFSGSKSGYDKLVDILKNVANSANVSANQQSDTPECVACFCPTDENVYCLELCGHYYCNECVLPQLNIAIRDKQFPITCVKENCNQPFVVKDFENILIGHTRIKDKSLEAQKWQPLVDSSVSHFIQANRTLYSFCMTPDCSGIYKKTKAADLFKCDICLTKQCRSCGNEYHPGVSCSEYDAMKRDDNISITRWMNEAPEKRKQCPGCKVAVEKNEGCMHMTCSACKIHFCWHCLFLAKTPGEVYGHLRSVHGSFY